MKKFDDLLSVVDELLGDNGCPWDREQTMKSMRQYILEEVSELIEAIDLEDNKHIEEELGDLFFNVIFLARLAEKEKRTSMDQVFTLIKEKLLSRHPHVFGGEKIETAKAVLEKWDEVKLQEKDKKNRKSTLDGIPKGLPALTRFQKVAGKMKKANFSSMVEPLKKEFKDESDLGVFLAGVALRATEQGLDAEHALKNYLYYLEKDFRAFEA